MKKPSTRVSLARGKTLLRVFAFLVCSLLYGVAQAQISVTSTAGTSTSASYATMNGAGGAFANVNNGTHRGIITMTVTASYTESAATITPLLASGQSSANYARIDIKTNGTFTITCSTPTASRGFWEFYGTDNVFIDGDANNGGSVRDLTFTSNSTTTHAFIRLAGSTTAGLGCTNMVVKNLNLTGNLTSTAGASGIIMSTDAGASNAASTFVATTAGNNNSNIRFENNNITGVIYGISATGAANTAASSQNVVIVGNTIGNISTLANSCGTAGIYVIGHGRSTDLSTGVQILNNTIASTNNGLAITAMYGIQSGGNMYGANISNNDIQINNFNTGGWQCTAISISGALATTTDITISNNKLYNIRNANYASGIVYAATGIYITGGSRFNIFNNNINLSGVSTAGTATTQYLSICLTLAATSSATLANVFVYNNIFNNTATAASGNTASGTSKPRSACVHLGTATVTAATGFNYRFNNNYYGIPSASSNNTDFFAGSTGSNTAFVTYVAGSNWATFINGFNTVSANESSRQGGTAGSNLSFSSGALGASPTTNLVGTGSNLPFSTPYTFGLFSANSKTRTTTYDIGAEAQSGTTDATAPSISYTDIPQQTSTVSGPTLSVTVSDASGLGLGGNAPKLYYRNATSASQTDWVYVTSTSTGSPYSFTIDYTKMKAIPSGGDDIEYFVAAADIFNNISTSPTVTFGKTPSSVVLVNGEYPASCSKTYNLQATPKSLTGTPVVTQTTVTNASPNVTNLPVLRISTVIGGNAGNVYLSALTVSLPTGVASSAIKNVKLFRTATTTFSTGTQVGSTTTWSGTSTALTIAGPGYDMPLGQSYFWVTFDILPSAAGGGVIDAQINAGDMTIGGTTYNASLDNPAGSISLISTYDFENGLQGWVSSSTGADAFASVTMPSSGVGSGSSGTATFPGIRAGGTGTKVMGTTINGTTLGYISNSYGSTTAGLIALSPSFGAVTNSNVSFWLWNDTETSYDYLYFEYSTDGGTTWTNLATYNGVASGWVNPTFNVLTVNGQTIQFRFRLTGDSFVYSGSYIDDFTYTSIVDVTAPVIAGTTTISGQTRANTANLTGMTAVDPTPGNGVATTTGVRPRLYYKLSSQANTSAFWKFVEATNTSSPFAFTIDYTAIGGVNVGDGVDYFWIAQDAAGTPNVVTSNASGSASGPVTLGGTVASVALTSANLTSVSGFSTFTIQNSPLAVGTPVYTRNLTAAGQGIANNAVFRLNVTAAGGSLNTLSLASLTVNGTASYVSTNVGSIRLWTTGQTATYTSPTQIGTAQTLSGSGASATLTFSGLSASVSSGNNYFWVTMDVPSGATIGGTIDLTVPANGIQVFNGTSNVSASALALTATGSTAITAPPLNYNVVRATGTSFTQIKGTADARAYTFGSTSRDDGYTNLTNVGSLGFSFVYQGTTYTSFAANTNGAVWLGTSQSGNYSNASPIAAAALYPLWDDLYCTTTNPANHMNYAITGATGSKVLTIEWVNMTQYTNLTLDMNFQVKLYQSDNHIEFVYGSMVGFAGSSPLEYSYTLGLSGVSNSASYPSGQTLYQQFNNTDNFNLGNASANALAIVPACNTQITFTPNASPTVNTTAANVPTNISSATATALTLASGNNPQNCNLYFTSLAGGAATAPTVADDGAWFSFTNPTTQTIGVNVVPAASTTPVIEVMLASNLSTAVGTLTGTTGLTTTLSMTNLAAGNYRIRVSHSGTGIGVTGGFSAVVFSPAVAPSNDNCAGATSLTINTNLAGTSLNATAGTTPAAPAVANGVNAADDDVWYSFTAADVLGTVTVTTVQPFNPVVEIWNTCPDVNTATTNRLTFCDYQSSATDWVINGNTMTYTSTTVPFVSGTTYYVRVYHRTTGSPPAGTNQFTIKYSLVPPSCPTIASGPTDGATTVAYDAPTTLTWGAITSAVGTNTYKVFFGSGVPTSISDYTSVGSATTYTSSNLAAGTTYRFYVITSNSLSGDCSDPSLGSFGTGRSFSTPDRDVTPPTVTITNYSNPTFRGNQTMANLATVIDLNLVDFAAKIPRLYYKKAASANTLAGWSSVATTSTSSPLSFVLDASLIGGLNAGDVISYFVTAADLSPDANVGATGVTFSSTPTNTTLVSGNFPVSGSGIQTFTVQADVTAPTISIPTDLTDISSLANRTLTAFATITEPTPGTGLIRSGTNVARLYYKKSTQASNSTNWKFVNATAYTGSGAGYSYDFTINYAALTGGSVSVGDVIQYFIVAQDSATTANVALSSGTTLGAAATSVVLGSTQLSGASASRSYTITAANLYVTTVLGTQPTTSMATGTTSNIAMRLEVQALGTLGTLSLNSLTVNGVAANAAANVSSVKLWRTGTNSSFTSATQIGSTTTFSGTGATATATFSGLSSSLIAASNYFWITVDCPSNATIGGTFDMTVNTNQMVFSAAPTTWPATAINPTGTIAITAPALGYNVVRSTGTNFTAIDANDKIQFATITSRDDASTEIVNLTTLGFTGFTYQGQAITTFSCNTNGLMLLNPSATSTSLSNNSTTTNALMPMWDDLYCGNLSANSSISYSVTGATGNKVLTVEWLNMENYLFGGPDLNWQVKLYAATNRIEFVYGNMTLFNGANPISSNSGNTGTGSEKLFTYTSGITGVSNSSLLPAGQSLIMQSHNTDNFRNVASDANALTPACNSTISFVPTSSPTLNTPSTVTYTNITAATAQPLVLSSGQVNDNCNIYISQATGAASSPTVADDGAYFSFTNDAGNNNLPVYIQVNAGAFFLPTVQLINAASPGTVAATATMVTSGTSLLLTYASCPAGNYIVRVFHSGTGVASSGTIGAFSIIAYKTAVPPANDECASAVSVAMDGIAVAGSTQNATAGTISPPVPTTGSLPVGAANDDVWFTISPTSAYWSLNVARVAPFNPAVEVWSTCPTDATVTNRVADFDLNGNASVTATSTTLAAGTYKVRVYHRTTVAPASGSSQFTISASMTAPSAPSLASVSGFTGLTPVAAPSIASGNNNVSYGRALTFTWSAVSDTGGSLTYETYLGSNATPSATGITTSGLTYVSANLSPAVTYYFAVRTISSTNGTSPWSSVTSYTTLAQPGLPVCPTLGSPADNVTAASRTPVFTWTNGANTVDARLEISTNSTFTNIVYNYTQNNGSWALPTANTLNANTTYFWRVVPRNAALVEAAACTYRTYSTRQANDVASGALSISAGATCSGTSGTTLQASQTNVEESSFTGNYINVSGANDDDVWYTVTPSATSLSIRVDGGVSAGTLINPVIEAFRFVGTPSNGGYNNNNYLGVANASSGATENLDLNNLTIGTPIYIRVYSASTNASAKGTFTICAISAGSYTGTSTIAAGNYGIIDIQSGAVATISSAVSASSVIVRNGGTLIITGSNALTAGSFTLMTGGSLEVGHPNGISATGTNGAILFTTGSFASDANYTYSGTGAQSTGTALPALVRNLNVNNGSTSGVLTLSQASGVTGVLNIVQGTFNAGTVSFTLASSSAGTARVSNLGTLSTRNVSGSNFTVQRWFRPYSTLATGQYYFIGSSVTGKTASVWNNNNGNTLNYASDLNPSVFFYNQKATWLNPRYPNVTTASGFSPAGDTSSAAAGRGLYVFFRSPVFANGSTVSVTGTLAKGSVTVPISICTSGCMNSTTSQPLNLVANPYASQIDFASVYTDNSSIIRDGFRVWSAVIDDYITVNQGVSDVPIASGGVSSIIASAQGFLVQATGNGTLTFTESHKSSASTNFARRESLPLLYLGLRNNATAATKYTVVAFRDNATRSTDEDGDGVKLSEEGLTIATTPNAGRNLAVNSMPMPSVDAETLNVFVQTTEAGVHTLDFTSSENLPADMTILLLDRENNTTTAVSANTVFTFNATAKDANRFALIYRRGATGNLNQVLTSKLNIFPNPSANGNVTLQILGAESNNAVLTVQDALGRVVSTKEYSIVAGQVNSLDLNMNLPSGVYNIVCNDGVKSFTNKLVIK